ncbi:MAG TPA: M4 family metallopeptidase [Polyangiaceae bacterium]|nr:M4 family metallopeptidase [Polyangiaceae bacterium]
MAHIRERSIQCILPPHMLESIARNGSPGQRASALSTLSVDHTLRSLRFARAMVPRVPTLATPTAYASPKPKRTIYTANQEEKLPGSLVRAEGSKASKDAAVDEAYDGLGATFAFYYEIFQRNSIDGHGLPLNASVHYGQDYDNAYWDGEQMVFGDGDKQIFERFTIAIDVIGHELTHGVTGAEVNLQYANQSGALNESISDVFGSLIKQYHNKQSADKADWLIGKGLLAAGIKGVALRSMKSPGTAYDDPLLGKDPQPGHMRDYVNTMSDNGGVHINSGIPNRAFYLAATALGGNAWDAAGKIWYATVRDTSLRSNASFRSFARRTIANAVHLYESQSKEHKAVANAWDEVGVSTT